MNKRQALCSIVGMLFLTAAFVLTVYNLRSDTAAGQSADAVLAELVQDAAEQSTPAEESAEAAEIPEYLRNPDMEMPTKEVDGESYIGVICIPALSLELPVHSEWSYALLKTAPCRYVGSAYQNNLVIAAHNYTTHFGQLKNLSPGDAVTFTDVDGNVFSYAVREIETLQPYDVDRMTSGEWDLTLFTCTLGGKSRITVRCEKTQSGTAQ